MTRSLIFIAIFILNVISNIKSKLSNEDFSIWGPGLKPHLITMPARYFFVQKSSVNNSCGKIQLNVKVEGTNEYQRNCRTWVNVFNVFDCFYIVRYKLYETCKDLTIVVKNGDLDVSESPYLIRGKVYSDDCDCTRKNLDRWLLDWECGDVPRQIIKDLSLFPSVDFKIVREQIIEKFDNPSSTSFCHYVIKNNKIYRKCYGKYVGFKMFIDNILLSLTRKLFLPDVEFFFNLGDWPLVKDKHLPMFSWCGSNDSHDIVFPTYDITESTLENMGRVMLDMLSVQGNSKVPWNERSEKLFWRGRDSNRRRLELIDLSRLYPELFNVSLTNFFFFRSEEAKYGPRSDHISFFNFFDYKYQLNIDGTVAAYRLPYLLAGRSLVFKVDSKYYEHFYNDLKPNVHFVPVKADLSDLIDKIEWAKNNDDVAKVIAQNGANFARNNLLPKDVFCYHTILLNEFSKRILSSIEILNDMELVESNPTDQIKLEKSRNCNCFENNKDEL